ncbi:MAG: hypothetical protein PHN44_07305 [Candidatus Marinimicrobia bacterium]|nr:hypothetical protein [Candidatus Neomarinimicrobiota bacterium]MDD5265151.1 hypothetical protein [Candidatus Bipolaricaulis sp.]
MVKEKKPLIKYKGVFHFPHQMSVIYRFAVSEKQAKARMLRALARRHGVAMKEVLKLFDGSKNNHEITIEMEIREA